MLLNPTGKGIRNDSAGQGWHGAPRGSRIHDGVDLLCEPGQEIVSPIDGIVKRYSNPYVGDDTYKGIVLINQNITIQMFYLNPTIPVDAKIKQGDVIGFAQDISKKHGGLPHIHFRIVSIDPWPLIIKKELPEDPGMFQSHV